MLSFLGKECDINVANQCIPVVLDYKIHNFKPFGCNPSQEYIESNKQPYFFVNNQSMTEKKDDIMFPKVLSWIKAN